MKRFMLLTIIVIILITVIILLGCCRNKKITSTDYVIQKELLLNVPFKNPKSNIEITAIEINKSRQCLIQIKNLSTGETKSGWVGEGDYASFAPEEIGTSGLQLRAITEKGVILNIRYGHTK